jgi:hypothetical protein
MQVVKLEIWLGVAAFAVVLLAAANHALGISDRILKWSRRGSADRKKPDGPQPAPAPSDQPPPTIQNLPYSRNPFFAGRDAVLERLRKALVHGLILEELGDSPGARSQIARGLKAMREILGAEHPDTETARTNLARLERKLNEELQAKQWPKRSDGQSERAVRGTSVKTAAGGRSCPTALAL